jgi:hypothetical protein
VYCHSGEDLSIDHIIPLKRGDSWQRYQATRFYAAKHVTLQNYTKTFLMVLHSKERRTDTNTSVEQISKTSMGISFYE